MFRRLITMALVCAIMMIASIFALADEYARVVISGTTTGVSTNSALFYNAKLLAVRAQNRAGLSCTNVITLYQITADSALTNTVAAITTDTTGFKDVSTNGFVQLRNDMLSVTASSNFVVEVTLDNRSR